MSRWGLGLLDTPPWVQESAFSYACCPSSSSSLSLSVMMGTNPWVRSGDNLAALASVVALLLLATAFMAFIMVLLPAAADFPTSILFSFLMLARILTDSLCNRQTDRQTDRQTYLHMSIYAKKRKGGQMKHLCYMYESSCT